MRLFSRFWGKKEQHESIDITQNQSKEQVETEHTDESDQKSNYSKYTVYFTNGHLSKIDPFPKGGYYENRDVANNVDFIISDGIKYDLTSVKSIHSIKIPSYTYSIDGGIGTTGFLEYVLRMQSGKYWNARNFNLSIACLEKATELMKYSTMGWPPKDFFRIVNELNDLGRLKKAKQWEKWIEHNIPGASSALIHVTTTDKSCGLSAYPYIWGVSEPTFKCDNPILYSNRPFIDDRTEEDIEHRSNWLATLNRQPEVVRKPNLDRIIYYRLLQLFPADSPKSFSGFSRMKKTNSKNYQALVKKVEAAGFVFPKTLEDVESWPENQ